MKNKLTLMSKICAVVLTLIISLASLTTAYAATEVRSAGSRGSQGFGIMWSKSFSFPYTDATGKSYTYKVSGGNEMKVHFFARQGETLSFSNYEERAYCIQPALYSELESHNNTYYYGGNLTSGGLDAYDKALTATQKKLLNTVLANGYGTLTPATREYVTYWYATQLLIYETIIGMRDENFELKPGYSGLKPTAYLMSSSGSETKPEYIEKSYNATIERVQLTLKNPIGAGNTKSSAPTRLMEYKQSKNCYEYTVSFDDILTNVYTTFGDKDVSELNVKDSDIVIESSPVDMNAVIDRTKRQIIFSSYQQINSNMASAVIKIRNPRTRGLNTIMTNNNNYGKYGLMLMQKDDNTAFQVFAIGASQLNPSYSYLKLRTNSTVILRIKKESASPDMTNDNPCYSLRGAEYGIYGSEEDANAGTNLLGIITTDENGVGVYSNSQGIVIPARDFWGKEIASSTNYGLDNETHHFTYSGEDIDGVPVFSFTSLEPPESDPITVLLQKYDATTGKGTNTEKLANAEFTVKFYPAYFDSVEDIGNTQPLRSWVFRTDSDGYLEFEQSYKVSGDDFWYADFYGELIPSLPFGTITVQETKAPAGYELNHDIYIAIINENSGNISWRTSNENIDESVLQFPESQIPNSTFITKTDITGDTEIPGAHLMVSEKSGKIIEEWISNGTPHEIHSLEKGKVYVLTETQAPDGYIIAESIEFTINDDNTPTQINMSDDDTKIQFTKVDEDGNRVANVRLQVLDSTNQVMEEWVTDGVSDKLFRHRFVVGKAYTLHEVSAPLNYVLSEDITFTVENVGSVQVIRMENKQTVTTISKKAITGSDELAGASLIVTDSSGSVIDQWTSGSTPHAIKGLEKGKTYTLTETSSPNGYTVSESIKFTINEDGSPTHVDMRDDTTKIEFVKVDTANKPVKGCTLQVLDSKGRIVDEWTTDGKTNHTISGVLSVGQKYKLHEVSAPKDYALSLDVSFTVKNENSLQSVKMVNKLKVGNVTLYKKDENGNKIDGSKWLLFDSNDNPISTRMSGSGIYTYDSASSSKPVEMTTVNGQFSVNQLPQGDYYFKEVATPDNSYLPYEGKVTFTISADSEETLNPAVTVKNNKAVTIQAGSIGNTVFYLTAGFSIILAAAFLFITLKRKEHV